MNLKYTRQDLALTQKSHISHQKIVCSCIFYCRIKANCIDFTCWKKRFIEHVCYNGNTYFSLKASEIQLITNYTAPPRITQQRPSGTVGFYFCMLILHGIYTIRTSKMKNVIKFFPYNVFM